MDIVFNCFLLFFYFFTCLHSIFTSYSITTMYWKLHWFSAGGYIFGLLGKKKVQREKIEKKSPAGNKNEKENGNEKVVNLWGIASLRSFRTRIGNNNIHLIKCI
jgi:hypothetical protein